MVLCHSMNTLRGGGDTRALPAVIKFELFAHMGSGDVKTSTGTRATW